MIVFCLVLVVPRSRQPPNMTKQKTIGVYMLLYVVRAIPWGGEQAGWKREPRRALVPYSRWSVILRAATAVAAVTVVVVSKNRTE